MTTRRGTTGNDILTGTSTADTLLGLAGNDRQRGGSGNDVLDGGNGNDQLQGDAGNDRLRGGNGADVLDGGTGNDQLRGDAGNDRLIFDREDSLIDGGTGTDTLQINGADVALNGTALARVSSIEVIDLRGSGANQLVIDAALASRLSDTDALRIRAGADDQVIASGGWVSGAETVIDGVHYAQFSLNGATLQIEAGADAHINGVLSLATLANSDGYRLNGAAAADLSGVSVAGIGDFNGDGLDDFVIGAPRVDNGAPDAGASYVVFGRVGSPAPAIALTNLDGSNGFRIDGEFEQGNAGTSVHAAGDVNGDGLADLVIGAPFASPGSVTLAGASYVVFGTRTTPAVMTLANLDATHGYRLDGTAALDRSGGAVSSAGDINGDGIDDVLIGAFGAGPGTAYVVFSTHDPVSGPVALSSLNGTNGFRLNGEAGLFLTAKALAGGGDINGDHIDDLVIGDPYDSGRSYVVFGHTGAFTASQDLAGLDGHNGFRVDGAGLNERSGGAVSIVGDINGDGIDDVVIGAIFASHSADNAGASYVVFGHRGDFTPVLSVSALDGSNGFRLDGVAANDGSGRSISGIGDINGDGYDDLLIGADGADANGHLGSGASYVLFGHGGGFGASVSLASLDGNSGLRIDGALADDGAGYAVAAAGDVDGDGYNDLLIGAPSNDTVAFNAGTSYVLYGRDFNGTVTRQGSAGNDVLLGTAGADSLIGGRGDDRLDGGGGADVLRGGAGNDVLIWNSAARVLDGGSGSDSLLVTQGGLDLSTVSARLSNLETIDLSAAGGNTLVLTRADLLQITSAPHLLTVKGDAGDLVNLDGPWQNHGNVVAGFTRYSSGAAAIDVANAVHVLVDDTVALDTLDGHDGVHLTHSNQYDLVVAAGGDLNGDGFADVLVGVRFRDASPLIGVGTAGVMPGHAGNFAASVDLATLGIANGAHIDGVLDGGHLGTSVSVVGDVNGDGHKDILLGAPGADTGHGLAYLLFGPAGGFAGSVDLSTLDNSRGQRLLGDGTSFHSGEVVSGAGDVNGDGYDDVLIGTSLYQGARVVFGHGGAFTDSLALSTLDGHNGFSATSSANDRALGAAGDVNGDGYDDLIFGSKISTAPGRSSSGVSYVVFGHAGAFAANVDISNLDATTGFRLNGAAAADYSGNSVAGAGDVNGDGFADLVVGDSAAHGRAGSSYVVFGHGGAFASDIDLGALDGHNGFRIDGGTADDRSGYAVSAAGDVNGDGYDDVLIGADVYGLNRGSAYVVFGHAGGFDPVVNLASASSAQVLHILGAPGGGFAGSSVSAAGDVNGDGYADLYIGAINGYDGYVVFGRDFNGVVTRQGGDGNDSLLGTGGADVLVGGLGNDVLDGLGGADALAGGAGDDTFIWYDGVRRIDGGGGSDRLRFTGQQNLFDLQASTAATVRGIDVIDLNLTGNNGLAVSVRGVTTVSDANLVRVEGNGGDFVIADHESWTLADGAPVTLNGQQYARYTSGPATLLIDTDVTVFQGSEHAPVAVVASTVFGGALHSGTARNDVLNGTAANNTLRGLAGNDKLNGLAGNDLLDGGAGNDILIGGAGNDKLDGGLGRDLLRGDAGNDTYVIDNAAEINKSTRDDGLDTVLSSVSYALGAQQEHLTLTGKLAINATGNALANTLSGNSGANTLDGGLGHDTLLGAAGNDRLIFDRDDVRVDGGAGVDTLVITGAGLALGHASLGAVASMEVIDLRGSGANRFAVDAAFADQLSDTSTLRVRADGNDTVFVNGGWTASGTTPIDGVNYTIYGHDGVILQVESVAHQLVNGALALASLDGSSGYRLDGAAAGDATGHAVSGVGDINGDGLADVLLGAFHGDPNALTDAGTSTLVFGRPTAIGATVDMFDVAADAAVHFNSAVAGDYSGFAVSAAGDVNGDGLADFVIGAYGTAVTSWFGHSYVVFGATTGTFAGNVSLDSLDGSNGFRLDGANGIDLSGFSVAAAGDVNGDGFGDVLIGAYGADQPFNYAGSSYVIFGHTGAFAPTLSLGALDGHNGFLLRGVGDFDQSARAVASAGDFNGDGFADLLIGARLADPNGADSGSSYIVFGHDGDFTDINSLDNPAILRLDGGHAGDLSGTAVASLGDVNGDGFDDAIVGAPQANGEAGASYVVFGHAGAVTPQNLDLLDGKNGFRIDGNAAGDHLGAAVSGAGDVNGDGYADLLIGAPQANNNAGASYVLFGHGGDFASTISVNALNGSNGLRLDGVTAGDLSGIAVSAAGDVDGDGYDDLLIGASGVNNGVGSGYVVYGRDFSGAVAWQGGDGNDNLTGNAADESLIGGRGDDTLDGGAGRDVLKGGAGTDVLIWDRDDRLIDGGGGSDTLRITHGDADLVHAGPQLRGIERIDLGAAGSTTLALDASAVRALGDKPLLTVDGDGADLVNLQGLWNNDGVHLAGYTRYSNHGATLDIATAVEVIDNGAIALGALESRDGVLLAGVTIADQFGFAVAGAGDVNGDGFADFIVGAPGADNQARDGSGTSYVVFGAANRLPGDLSLATLDGSQGFRIDGAAAGDHLGGLVSSAGDVNGDGFDDLLIGHVGDGAQQLLFGHGGAFTASIDTASLAAQSGMTMTGVGVTSMTTAGDFNGDGFADVIIGARSATVPGNNAGASYLLFGSAHGLPASLDLTALQANQGIRIDGSAQDASGAAVDGGGDVNGDGFDDVLIGAPFAGAGNDHSGASFVVFGHAGSANGPLSLASLDGSNGLRINGASAGDTSGYSLAFAGDINGDGLSDIIINASNASPHGSISGSSYVVFGTQTPFSATLGLADLDGHNGFRLDGAAPGEHAYSVTGAGDVNGDGYDDLLIGAAYANSGHGKSFLVFGHGGSFDAVSNLGELDGQQGLRLLGADNPLGYSGISVSAAGDIDGDGFADILIGAPDPGSSSPSTSGGGAYVIHGRDFTGSVTQQGGSGNDTLIGSTADDNLVGGQGADVLDGAGGADVLIGGAGDDVLIWHGGVHGIDGGSGSDTLRAVGSDVVIDFTQADTPRIAGIDVIDLTGSGNNLLELDVHDVLHMSDHDTLRIDGNAGDVLLSRDQGWQRDAGAAVTIGGQQYVGYTLGGAHLLADTDLTQIVS